jgi:hypothetical protein
MATDKAHVFELEVYKRGKLEKTLRNDTGKITLAAIDDLAAIADQVGDTESQDVTEIFTGLKESLAPILYEMFADYEEGDIDHIDLNDLYGFIRDYSTYMKARFKGSPGSQPAKNRQGVAPRTKR